MNKYICISAWLAIKQGDIVEIEIGEYQVYIKWHKSLHCATQDILDEHFIKL